MTIYQYAKTTNQDVLDAIRRNEAGQAEFHERACAFAIEQGVEKGSYYPDSFGSSRSIRAIGGDVKPTTGRWKQGYGGHGWRPFKNNPLAAAMDAIEFRAEPIPGVPGTVFGPYTASGGQHVQSPRPFIVDDVAYYGVSFVPEPERHEGAGGGAWVEIKASEWHAAAEAFNERLKEGRA